MPPGPRFAFAKALASSRMGSEDRAEVFEQEEALVIVVADGAGGQAGGAAASDALVAAVRATLASGMDPFDIRVWSEVLEATDVALATKLVGETTGVIVAVGPSGIAGVSAGDSEAWLVSTRDVVTLTSEQTRWRVGSGRTNAVAFHRPALDGVLVVATDGLSKYVDLAAIAAACTATRSPAVIARELTVLPRLPSGSYPDDVAVVVVRG